MNLMQHSFRSVVLFLLMATMAYGQEVEFITKVDRDSVALGQAFKVEFQLKNAQGSFSGPDLSDFHILGGPNYMSSYSMINGTSNMEQTYSYILEAKEEGVFEIGSAVVETGDELLESTPVEIIVYFDPDVKREEPRPVSPQEKKRRKNSIRI